VWVRSTWPWGLHAEARLLALLLAVQHHTTRQHGTAQVSELLMLRAGCDVCCTSMDDKERVVRVDEAMTGSLMGGRAAAPASGSSSS
jgi:hypothetical protein